MSEERSIPPVTIAFQKQIAIAGEIVNMAEMLTKNARIAFPPKRPFRKKDRRPLKRLKREWAILALDMAPEITRARIAMITSQPIPNFIPGGIAAGSPAIVGERDPEHIITDHDTSVRLPDGIIGKMHHELPKLPNYQKFQ